jgi:hypothetical protein
VVERDRRYFAPRAGGVVQPYRRETVGNARPVPAMLLAEQGCVHEEILPAALRGLRGDVRAWAAMGVVLLRDGSLHRGVVEVQAGQDATADQEGGQGVPGGLGEGKVDGSRRAGCGTRTTEVGARCGEVEYAAEARTLAASDRGVLQECASARCIH